MYIVYTIIHTGFVVFIFDFVLNEYEILGYNIFLVIKYGLFVTFFKYVSWYDG